MEKRIKALYIITIIAIIAFLAMQMFWLHGRYEHSLGEYERGLSERISKCVDDYNTIREKMSDTRADSLKDKGNGADVFSLPTFSLQQEYGDTVKTTRTARIYTYLFSAHELLGLEPGTPLTDEQKRKAADLAQMQMAEPADSAVFDASGARDEQEAWTATNNLRLERKCPFRTDGIDSLLRKNGIKAETTLVQADSTVWRTRTEDRLSLFAPSVTMTIPYSQLQGRSVRVESRINPLDILPGIWRTLVIALVVSGLLIVCLVLQFSTVLKLSRLDRLRNSFVTTMIHELKRPLSTLKMCVSGLDNERMVEDREVRKELLGETRSALDNLSAYFSRLRDITFNDVEQIPLNITGVNLYDLFDAVSSATVAPSGKSVTITNAIPPDMVVSADSSHLQNIMVNLVENAVKYSGPEVAIRAEAGENEGYAELRVIDNGDGIPQADLRHIFKRFYRGRASAGEHPGMGLGLTYVRLLVEAHGGEISVESTVGRGTCFTIKLPQ